MTDSFGRRTGKQVRRLIPGDFLSTAALAVICLFFLVISAVEIAYSVKNVGRPFPGFRLNQRMVVANVGQYSWTGVRAGLNYPDMIVRADGREVSSLEELHGIVSGKSAGTPVTYAVEKEGEVVKLVIPTMVYSWKDFFLTQGIFILAGIAYFFLGLVVYILKSGTNVSWAFLFTCFFLSIFNITADPEVSLALDKVNLLSFTFIPAALFHLGLVFPQKKRVAERFPFLQFVPYGIALLLGAAMAAVYPGYPFTVLYPLANIYVMLGALFFVGSILLQFLYTTSPVARQRVKVVLLGAALAFPIPAFLFLVTNLGIEIEGISFQNNFSGIPLLIFPASIAFAIARHNLFDVDVYIKRTVGYVLMTAIVGGGYTALQLLAGPAVLRPLFGDYAQKIYALLFALLVVFLFNPVNQRVQGAVERLFYRKEYDYRETVTTLSDTLTTMLDLEGIIRQIIHTVRDVMFIDTAGVILLDAAREECPAVFIGDDEESGKSMVSEECLTMEDPFVKLMTAEKKLVTEYDVAENPHFSSVKEAAGKRFSDLGSSMALPLMSKGRLTGILSLGQKKSGKFYNREDINLLGTLTNQGSIAIENARLVDQMKHEEMVRTNLTRYLSPQFVDKVINDDMRVDLGGNRKRVTVLFSDIRDFTSITETRPPDQLVSVLNEYFTAMANCVFESQGTIDKYIGDAIMATFGSLVSLDNPAQNAVRAAKLMMEILPELNQEWEKEYEGFTVQIGVGITTGEVFLGNIGSPERMEYTVIGDTVNVASRFSGLAEAGQIIVGRETLEALGEEFRYRVLPPAPVKGKSGRLEVFEILY
jgi:class 3 adenylate cyclase